MSVPSLGDGCPSKQGYQETEAMTSMSQKAAVACCSIDGYNECVRGKYFAKRVKNQVAFISSPKAEFPIFACAHHKFK